MLVIYAHPNKKGNNGYILKTLQRLLDKKKIEYKILDLYEMNFGPVLKPKEHYTSGENKIGEDVKKIQELMKTEDKFIFIYPTWWNGTPAILKGFFDRVLTPGYAYRYVNHIPLGLLKGRAVVITTTGGPKIYEKTFAGDKSLRVVIRDTLLFSGIKAKGFMIDRATTLSNRNKRLIEKTIPKALKYLGL
ncbi:MAG: NADPH dehydrogenase [Candidatus Colwellbacteria bacterium CG10_big_fil_rev_8_21_14_0_10_42_22]|uniref:NADPH dehydrogenase n=1 Tax=Candidatus Colwellbacteria bacterium CG10_big_fil_rev_8_21_14_0_10_42_22 TaxID=1974540 RepID=A0A2H0VFT9_9BACT|nr:MAG: NADPH dehydrogenase [Candidatus Colwellbacteria bacterium CG10_big_fil_rev_8_21_14_0_10_42_22]